MALLLLLLHGLYQWPPGFAEVTSSRMAMIVSAYNAYTASV
jgi:hypothetical protein